MAVTIHQPQYLPWIGFFHKVSMSNKCVLLDNVEYSKNDFFNRNKIRTSQGWMWLTVPVYYKSKNLIKNVEINNTVNWRKKHWHSLVSNYSKAKYFNLYSEALKKVYDEKWDLLVDINNELMFYITKEVGAHIEFILASELNVSGKGTELLVEICKSLNATTYISGIGGKGYLDERKFAQAGIELIYQDFKHPVYPQRFRGFEPNMSVLDLMFNCGEKSLEIIMETTRGTKWTY